jgi:hypothetical protein
MSGQPDGLGWTLKIEVSTDIPGPHWTEETWRNTYRQASRFWGEGLVSDFGHVWNDSRLPYARRPEPVEQLARDLAEWRRQNEDTLLGTGFASVKLSVFRVTLRGIWDEDLAIIDVLADPLAVEWYGADTHY